MNHRLTALLIFLSAVALGGCSTAPVVKGSAPEETVFSAQKLDASDVDWPLDVYDPLEGMNRTIYRFNYHADRWVLIPAVNAYRFVTPGFVRTGVSNFFDNFFGIRTLMNQILQGRPVRALQTTGRIVVNTTLGIGGLFDIATPMGIPYDAEDFGQTLGVWGVKPGAYLVLPFFGPSSLRDGFGLGVDSAFQTWLDPLDFDDHSGRQYAYYPLMVLDTRDRIAFRYYQTGSPFEYELVRRLIRTVREIEVQK
jgi:phospholipid-binding lipoprotein MlaA